MNEIATIKQENGRLIEKYKFEQKQVHKLKDDLKKKQKYEQFFVTSLDNTSMLYVFHASR